MSKEFEKWWEYNMTGPVKDCNSHLGFPEAKEAWKAALEWTLRLHYDTALDTIDELEKELNDV